jgi:hypothetical protein
MSKAFSDQPFLGMRRDSKVARSPLGTARQVKLRVLDITS